MSEKVYPKRLVIYSPFFFPEVISTGKVNTLISEELVRRGWHIDVVCSHPLYPDWKPVKSEASLPGVKFYRGGVRIYYAANPLLRRIALELWFALHAAIMSRRLPKDVDVALMVYPPSLFGPVVMKLLPKRIKRIVLVHDMQSEYSQRGYHSGFSLLTWLINAVEGSCLRDADRCIFFSKDIARAAQSTFGLDEEHLLVHYPFVTIDSEAKTTDALGDIMPAGIQHVVYSGALGEKQNPRLLAKLMEKAAQQIPNTRCHIFSAGPNFEALKREFRAKGVLQFHNLIPEEQLTELYSRSTVQVIPQAPGTESGSLPSKLPNLLAAGVPILSICSESSEVAELLRSANTGVIVPDWTEEQFLAGVKEALRDAATVPYAKRREGAAEVLALCRVSSLADLIVA